MSSISLLRPAALRADLPSGISVPPIQPLHPWPPAKLRNLEQVYADIAAGRAIFRGLPPVLGLHTSEICNLRCVMCERSRVPGTRKLDRAVLQRLIGELFPTAIKAYVTGSSGEPLLGDFDVILAGALTHEVGLDLVTNGTHLTLERYRAMRSALVRVNVSVDAHVPEIYERIRAGGRFATVQRNLRAIAAERRREADGVVLDISAVLMRSNAAILPDFVRFGAELGVDHVNIQMLRHFAHPLPDEELDPEPRVQRDRSGGRPHRPEGEQLAERVAVHLEAIAEAARAAGVNVTFGDFSRPPVLVRAVPTKLDGLTPPVGVCWNVAVNFAVQFDGSVYPCCHPTDYRLGNVLDSTLDEIWNGPVAQRLRQAHFARRRLAFCTGCIEAPYLGAARTSVTAAMSERARLAVSHYGNALRTALGRHARQDRAP